MIVDSVDQLASPTAHRQTVIVIVIVMVVVVAAVVIVIVNLLFS